MSDLIGTSIDAVVAMLPDDAGNLKVVELARMKLGVKRPIVTTQRPGHGRAVY
ncbi:MAG: hypothetical protein R3D55_14925 [Chloroflexota bacterium]